MSTCHTNFIYDRGDPCTLLLRISCIIGLFRGDVGRFGGRPMHLLLQPVVVTENDICRVLLWTYRALLHRRMDRLNRYRALLRMDRALLSVYRALF